MEIEVMMPSPAPVDFNLDSGCTTPCMSAPSSPPCTATLFYSAPASPTRISDEFNWEEVPKERDDDDDDFSFDISVQLEKASLATADELFEGGKIKPLQPPPRLHMDSPKSPKKLFEETFSPRHNESNQENTKKSASVSSSSSVSSMISQWSKKWKIKGLLRPSSTEQLNKSELLKKSHDVKNLCFRWPTKSVRSRKKGPIPAASGEMKKKTFSPCKQGLLCCLGFNAALQDSIS